ncbi:hypothetical protein MRB53_040083 [Persea americana]|nr:hypothetical protein MRB53_040083 [Persea americana]
MLLHYYKAVVSRKKTIPIKRPRPDIFKDPSTPHARVRQHDRSRDGQGPADSSKSTFTGNARFPSSTTSGYVSAATIETTSEFSHDETENQRKRNSKSPSLKPSTSRNRSASDTVVPLARTSKASSKAQYFDTSQSDQGHLRPPLTDSFSVSIDDAAPYAADRVYWESDQVVVTPPLDGRDSFYQNPSIISSGRPSPALNLSASRAQSVSSDTFDTPSHVDQMFEFCKSCAYIIILVQRHWQHSVWLLLVVSSVTSECSHADLIDFGAVRQGEPAFEYDLYKARVYRDINERMKTSETAVTDETVGYLACLLSYENLHSKYGKLTRYSLDLTHALLFDTDPMITVADPACDVSQTRMETYQGACSVLRLLHNEHDDFQHMVDHEHAPYRERLQTLPELFKSVTNILTGYMEEQNETTASLKAERAETFKRALERFREMSIVPDASAPDAHYLARIVYLRALLIYNVSVHHLAGTHPVNQSYSSWNVGYSVENSRIHLDKSALSKIMDVRRFRMAQSEEYVSSVFIIIACLQSTAFIIRYISSKTLSTEPLDGADDVETYASASNRLREHTVSTDANGHDSLEHRNDHHTRSSSMPMAISDGNACGAIVSAAIDADATELAYRTTQASRPASIIGAASVHSVQAGWTGGTFADLQSYYNIRDEWTSDG